MAALAIVPVKSGRMCCHTILCRSQHTISYSDHQEKVFPTYIPNNHVSWRPFHANLEILPEGNMIVQELQQEIAFLLLVSDDVSSD